MGEFDSARTYAIRKLQFALISSSGQPVSLHQDADGALAAFVKMRGGIILDEDSRQQWFKALAKWRYKICPAYAWCRVDQERAITKLPKEKHLDRKPAKKAKRARPRAARADDRTLPSRSRRAKRGQNK